MHTVASCRHGDHLATKGETIIALAHNIPAYSPWLHYYTHTYTYTSQANTHIIHMNIHTYIHTHMFMHSKRYTWCHTHAYDCTYSVCKHAHMNKHTGQTGTQEEVMHCMY